MALSLQAQTTGGPDQYGYIWRNDQDPNGPVYNWIEIDGLADKVEVTSLQDDNTSAAITLPVPFHYYWYDVTKFYIGSNGYITFASNTQIASAQLTNGFPQIPFNGDPNNTNNDYIAAQGSDLIFGSAGGNQGRCYYYISPTHDSVVVTWDSVPFWDQNLNYVGANTFQLILNYADSSILVNYKMQNGASAATTGFCTTGIENNSGSLGLQYLFDVYPTAGSSVKYYYPSSTTFAVNDASTVYNDNPDNGAVFLSKNGTPYTLTTVIANSGNQPLSNFNIQSQVRNANNVQQVNNVFSAGPLAPAQTQTVSHTNQFTPSTAGIFYFRTDTQLGGDLTPTNNRKDVEIDVVDTTQATIELAYENATASTGTNSWSGGDGGSAVYFQPPFTPYVINSVKAFPIAGATPAGYAMLVYDDNGLNGGPGTLLDSIMEPSTFTSGAWKTTTLTSPITKTSGGFYVVWFMGGPAVGLGTVATLPISNRTFEVLGGTDPQYFAIYRDRASQEFMLRAEISKVVGVNEIEKGESFSAMYPNPSAEGKVYMAYDLSTSKTNSFTVKVYNTNGQVVQAETVNSVKGTLELDIHNLESGIYMCRISNGSTETERKFTVAK